MLAALAAGWAVLSSANFSGPDAPLALPAEEAEQSEKEAGVATSVEGYGQRLAEALARNDEAETERVLAEAADYLETHPEAFSLLTARLRASPEIRRHLPELVRLTVEAKRYRICGAAVEILQREPAGRAGE